MNREKLEAKISQFNEGEGHIDRLIDLLSDCGSDLEGTVSIINAQADNRKLELLVLQPLKISEKYLAFINASAKVEVIGTDIVYLRKLLNQIKTYDNDNLKQETHSLMLRSVLLSISKSELKSYDVFTNFDTDGIDKDALRNLLRDENNWINERVKIHRRLTSSFLRSAEILSRKIARSKKMGRGIYCVRGSVASGKSSFTKGFLSQNLKSVSDTSGVLNTDAIKMKLVANTLNVTGNALSGYVFHEEASIIGEKILDHVTSSNLSYVIDKRMQEASDIDRLLFDAKQRKLPITIFDVKVDFITSALRVLERTGVYPSDPTPDFLALFNSYKNVEENRPLFLEKALGSKLVKDYSAVLVRSNGQPMISVIKKNYKVNKENFDRESEGRFTAKIDSLKKVVLSGNKMLQAALDEHSNKSFITRFSGQEYLDKLLRNISNTSRTFGGELNVTASKDKPKIVNQSNSKEDLAHITKRNVMQAFDFAYDNKNLILLSPQILKDFIDQIAKLVNQDIIKDEKFLLRRGSDSHKYFYVSTKYVNSFYESFINQLYEKLNAPETSSVDLAAWIEWNVDFCGHIFSDGCGRTAKILSSWILMRANSDLPDYQRCQDGFDTIRESYRKRFAIRSVIRLRIPANTKNFYVFLRYYRRLFESKVVYKILASGGLVYNSLGQFLILQTSKGKDFGKWVVPGGKLDLDETPIDAFAREVFEETGLTVKHVNLLGVRDYTAKSGNHYQFYDYASSVEDDKQIRINEESLAFKWITKDRISDFTFTDSIMNFINKYFIFGQAEIYEKSVKISEKNFDTPYFADHTMTTSLEKYIESKLPTKLIDDKANEIDRFEVHGIYPDLSILNDLNLGFNIVEVVHLSKQKVDNSNSLRPLFLVAERASKKILICCVTPGRDLLIHYASMIKYYLRDTSIVIDVYAYPLAEKKIDKWTGLDEKMIVENDTVILGYSTFFRVRFEKDVDFSVVSTHQNRFYTATRFIAKNGKVINCLEANYGHWGNISDFLAQKICQLKASEILHIGKVGTLKSPNEVYRRIYIPDSFVVGRRDEIMRSRIKNSMEYMKEYSSLTHVSVATTMEETFNQRESFSRQKIETIDIESSKIAQAVALYNFTNKAKIMFGAIHFSSDYLKKSGESDEGLDVDLSTDRDNLKHYKQTILNEIYFIIKKHVLDE
jgi:ADP-ribose pyrophosphatase YjhB (NUDIX family)